MTVTIWVDADALPSVLKDYMIKIARKREVPTVFVSNKTITVPSHPLFQSVQVDLGADLADAYIVEQAQVGDLAITQDVPLADLLVSKGVSVINLRGEAFTPTNMKGRLAVRDFMTDLRNAGIQTKGPKPFDDKQKQAFMNGFDKALTQCLK
ncbi:MAG: YaiI/YqxD family protein [Vampirovibrionales bacterium]|jgi:uncharacterized protein YaiI (UPF0178 family)|nr:YaiI/YqxD family protein [Vampirovibrionales bacterium]